MHGITTTTITTTITTNSSATTTSTTTTIRTTTTTTTNTIIIIIPLQVLIIVRTIDKWVFYFNSQSDINTRSVNRINILVIQV